jgi:hypothetical protein
MRTSQLFLRDAQRRFIGALTALALIVTTPLARATVDDAHGFAMEAATPFVEDGFIVREDYWHGDVMSEQKLMVRHQLFKGNEYAFWLGTANEECVLELEVLDEAGKAVHIDRKADKNGMYVSIRVNPPKTGTYAVVFSLKSKREKSITWALAYGYR